MRRIAEILSEPFPFCRVDLYNPEGNHIIFGEITFFHSGGNNRIEPEEFQHTMGSWVGMPEEGNPDVEAEGTGPSVEGDDT